MAAELDGPVPCTTPTDGTDTQTDERVIGILVHDGVLLMNIAGPGEVFAAANREQAERFRRLGGHGCVYRIELLSAEGGGVRTSAGIEVRTRALAEVPPASLDTVAVAGGVNVHEMARDERVLDWLRAAARSVRRYGGFGGGAFVLASAGLLDGRACVTHWRYASSLQQRYPRIRVDPDAIFVRDGACFTSAGSTAAIDLAMQMVEEDHDAPLAVDIARALVLPRKRPGEQPQISVELRAQQAALPRVAVAAQWIVGNIESKPSVARLAEQFSMSERNFSRLFKREMGLSPQRFLEQAKLEAARRWLAESGLPIEKVARRSGYSGGEHMAQVFRKALGITPGEYRARTRAGSSAARMPAMPARAGGLADQVEVMADS